jgi:hypothetical protein
VIVMAAYGANAVGNADVANMLLKNLRKGTKKQAVIDTLENVANLAYISGTFVHFPRGEKVWTEESVKAIKVAAACWEDAKKPTPEPKDIDAAEALDDLCQRLVKAALKSKLVHADLLPRLQALNAAIKGELIFEE